ncbi:MAG: DUF3192 domain-containing protein [Elusimicrobia bacterium]|nr:DUF3192 domain-containing protein [Elusimicrobiota bacterium]
MSRIRATNRERLNKISIGMTKQEVINIMGTKTIIADDSGEVINNPYKTETMRGKDKIFEVVYYYTEIKRADGAINDDELTPLVFDEGKLIGWGWSFFEDTTAKYQIKIR